jgi:dehydrogenase/reductase SDR family member 12
MQCQNITLTERVPVRNLSLATVSHSVRISRAGRTVMVTGANSGLGLAAAQELARRGASVHIVCRDAARGAAAHSTIHTAAADAAQGGRVTLWQCDLSSVRDVRRFAAEWCAAEGTLDCLVNNAGAMTHEHVKSNDGLEMNFALNVVGMYTLTELLLPALANAVNPRVVTISSGGMLLAGREAFDEKTSQGADLLTPATDGGSAKIDGQLQYARNKRCQVGLTEHWARKYHNKGVFWAVMHPGWASTPGLKVAMPEFHSTFSASLRTQEEGADTAVWLAISDEALTYPQAQFYLDRCVVPKHMWLAGTGYSTTDVDGLVEQLERGLDKVK